MIVLAIELCTMSVFLCRRLEVHIEIGLPDLNGRHQILKIHTMKMSKNSFLDKSVDLVKLSEGTKNFSGAEIEGLVASAVSFGLNRHLDITDLNKPIDDENVKVWNKGLDWAGDELSFLTILRIQRMTS